MYNTVYGKAEGSTYFNFYEMGELFEKDGFSDEDRDIDNVLDPFNGWRLPTAPELEHICAMTDWTGATVNGDTGKHHAAVYITGVTHPDSPNLYGLLLFPDGETIIGKTLDAMDDGMRGSTDLTLSELNAYLAQGCVFLPESGQYINGYGWYCVGNGYCWSSSENEWDDKEIKDSANRVDINNGGVDVGGASKSDFFPVRLVKSVE